MVKLKVLLKRTSKLREYIEFLNRYKHLSLAKFKDDELVRAGVERYLHLASECVFDIGNHIIADLELGEPNSYREIIEILGRKGILPLNFSEKLKALAGFRNILVHDYLEVDISLVHEVLQNSVQDLEEFLRIIEQRFI